MQPDRENRTPQMLGAKPAENVVFRTYHPPIPITGEELKADDGSVAQFRDFKIQKVEFAGDGSMVLHSVVKVSDVPDMRPEARLGDRIQGWMELIAAVIDPDGHIRAESIVLGPEEAFDGAPPGIN